MNSGQLSYIQVVSIILQEMLLCYIILMRNPQTVFVQKSLPYTGSSVITYFDSVIDLGKFRNEIINNKYASWSDIFVFVIKTE